MKNRLIKVSAVIVVLLVASNGGSAGGAAAREPQVAKQMATQIAAEQMASKQMASRQMAPKQMAKQGAKSAPCSAAEYRQFDFWVGDWDAFEADKPESRVARVKVESILDGCVVHEDYQATDGTKGQSFSIYDLSRKTWHQSWVTNRGRLLVIEGSFLAGEMVMSGVERVAGGEQLVRGVWKPTEDRVREIGEISSDGGKTWKGWFDLVFRKHHA